MSGPSITGFPKPNSLNQLEFCNWAFNLPRGVELRKKWDLIPNGIDLLITHGPPHGIGDRLENGEHVGCEELWKALQRVKPRIHVCGHIHGGYGIYSINDGATTIVNASNCDEGYRPVNSSIVIDSGFSKLSPQWCSNK